jgi:hypothetical protein
MPVCERAAALLESSSGLPVLVSLPAPHAAMKNPTTNTEAAVSLDMGTRFLVLTPVGDETGLVAPAQRM